MSAFEVALFLHVIGAMAFVAGTVLAGVAFEAARRRTSAGEVALLLSLARAGAVLVVAGAILAGGCGLWLAHLADESFSTEWVWLSAALFVLALVLGGLGGRRPRQARELASAQADGSAAPGPELRRLLEDRASRWANYLSAAAVLAIIYLMVTKP